MPAEERQAFMARLSADKQLKQATDELRLLFVGVQEAALQQRLNQFHEGVATTDVQPAKVVRMAASRKWAVAASLLIVVSVAAWLFFTRGNRKEDIYATYY